MRVLWLARAIRHLIDIRAYIAAHNPAAAEAVSIRVVEASERLAMMPEFGRPGRVLGTRELVVFRTPYIIVYRVKGETIEIVAVRHGAREWPKSFP